MVYQDLKLNRTPKDFRGRSKVYVQLWWIVQALLFNPSPQVFYRWRNWLLRRFGASIGKGVLIRPSVTVTYPWKLSIGDYSWIGDDVTLYTLGEIKIGSNSVVSQRSYLCAGSHDHKKIDFPLTNEPITIEDECWVATDVYIAPGVCIGKGTIVGARSSVFKSLPGGNICVGSPARIIKERKGYDD
ncbi:colanic acid biosynthesis acetyltransferase WcaF [Robertkochia sp. 1368]|nr:colanic acid biosynthesis acetyltransferase WcaF [Robertkochia sediminum]